MSNRFKRVSAVLGAVVLTVAGCAGAASPTPAASSAAPGTGGSASAPTETVDPTQLPIEEVSLQLDFVIQPRWAPLLRGNEEGFFASRGIDLDVVPGRGSDLALQQINSGNVDFAVVDLGNFLTQRAAGGTESTAVYAYINIPTVGIASFEELNDPADMAGKTFGTVPQSSGRINIPLVLHQNDVEWDEDSLLQLMDFSVLYPTLFEGTIDTAEVGLLGSWEGAYLSAQEQGKELYLKLLVDWGFFDYGSVIIARNEVIENNPELVERVIGGVHESLTDALANATADEIYQITLEADPQAEEATTALVWKNIQEFLKDPGPIDPEVIQYKLDRLTEQGTDVSDIVVEETYTNDFIPTN